MRISIPLWLLTVGAPLLLGAPSGALACSAPYCAAKPELALSEGQTVPANFGELTAFSRQPFPFPGDYTLRLWEADTPARVLSTREINGTRDVPYASLGEPLEQGQTYTVEVEPACDSEGPAELRQLSFTVGPASEPPATLGPLKLIHNGRAEVAIGDASGGCYDYIDAIAADLTLDAAHLPSPWRDLLTNYQLMVDGEPFSWQMTIGGYGPTEAERSFYFHQPGTFRVWSGCARETVHQDSNAAGIAPGKHTVWVRARVPSIIPSEIESERLEVSLSCTGLVAEDDTSEADEDGAESSRKASKGGCNLGWSGQPSPYGSEAIWLGLSLGAWRGRKARSTPRIRRPPGEASARN